MKKVVLITGATGGIGFQIAQFLQREGYIVYGAGRDEEKIKKLDQAGIHGIQFDMTDKDSMVAAVTTIISQEGHIDVLINNAGYGSYGAIEDVDLTEARRQFEVNLFGVAELTKLVLPHMRRQKEGRVINVSSMGGRFTSYFVAWYHATKYALEAFSDALRMEVASFGIQVVLIEPGLIKTDWGFIAAEHLKDSAQNGAYEKDANQAAEHLKAIYSGQLLSQPVIISKTISKAVSKKKPKPRYLVGFGAKPLVFLHTILPARCFDFLMVRGLR